MTLADMVTRVQNPETGMIPTFWMGNNCAYGYENFWINCLLHTANGMMSLADFIKEQEQVPFVPVYSAENDDSEDIPIFEAGEEVTHPKYGRGVVEKMIKYGNKTLYSVNFHASGIGRRLLDPVITELKKLK